jgi:hypothetical protein
MHFKNKRSTLFTLIESRYDILLLKGDHVDAQTGFIRGVQDCFGERLDFIQLGAFERGT